VSLGVGTKLNKSDFTDILNDPARVIRYFNKTPDIDIVHFGTADELWCHAILLIADRSLFDNLAHALISFWKKDCIFNEELSSEDVSAEQDAGRIARAFYSDCMEYEFKNLSKQEFFKEIDIATEGIKNAILKRPERSQGPLNWSKPETYWGIFVNNRRITAIESYSPRIEDQFLNGLFLSSKWNDIKLFAATENQYLYFNWSTGA